MLPFGLLVFAFAAGHPQMLSPGLLLALAAGLEVLPSGLVLVGYLAVVPSGLVECLVLALAVGNSPMLPFGLLVFAFAAGHPQMLSPGLLLVECLLLALAAGLVLVGCLAVVPSGLVECLVRSRPNGSTMGWPAANASEPRNTRPYDTTGRWPSEETSARHPTITKATTDQDN